MFTCDHISSLTTGPNAWAASSPRLPAIARAFRIRTIVEILEDRQLLTSMMIGPEPLVIDPRLNPLNDGFRSLKANLSLLGTMGAGNALGVAASTTQPSPSDGSSRLSAISRSLQRGIAIPSMIGPQSPTLTLTPGPSIAATLSSGGPSAFTSLEQARRLPTSASPILTTVPGTAINTRLAWLASRSATHSLAGDLARATSNRDGTNLTLASPDARLVGVPIASSLLNLVPVVPGPPPPTGPILSGSGGGSGSGPTTDAGSTTTNGSGPDGFGGTYYWTETITWSYVNSNNDSSVAVGKSNYDNSYSDVYQYHDSGGIGSDTYTVVASRDNGYHSTGWSSWDWPNNTQSGGGVYDGWSDDSSIMREGDTPDTILAGSFDQHTEHNDGTGGWTPTTTYSHSNSHSDGNGGDFDSLHKVEVNGNTLDQGYFDEYKDHHNPKSDWDGTTLTNHSDTSHNDDGNDTDALVVKDGSNTQNQGYFDEYKDHSDGMTDFDGSVSTFHNAENHDDDGNDYDDLSIKGGTDTENDDLGTGMVDSGNTDTYSFSDDLTPARGTTPAREVLVAQRTDNPKDVEVGNGQANPEGKPSAQLAKIDTFFQKLQDDVATNKTFSDAEKANRKTYLDGLRNNAEFQKLANYVLGSDKLKFQLVSHPGLDFYDRARKRWLINGKTWFPNAKPPGKIEIDPKFPDSDKDLLLFIDIIVHEFVHAALSVAKLDPTRAGNPLAGRQVKELSSEIPDLPLTRAQVDALNPPRKAYFEGPYGYYGDYFRSHYQYGGFPNWIIDINKPGQQYISSIVETVRGIVIKGLKNPG